MLVVRAVSRAPVVRSPTFLGVLPVPSVGGRDVVSVIVSVVVSAVVSVVVSVIVGGGVAHDGVPRLGGRPACRTQVWYTQKV